VVLERQREQRDAGGGGAPACPGHSRPPPATLVANRNNTKM
jgi:hypothetical protein